jgi:hypothetical protein
MTSVEARDVDAVRNHRDAGRIDTEETDGVIAIAGGERDESTGAPCVALQTSLPGVAVAPLLPARALKELMLGVGECGFDPLGCSVCGDPGQIAAETNRQLTAATNPIEHLQLGAVEVCDDGHGRCDPSQRVVLRREVMKMRDHRACGPTSGKEPLPGGDLPLGVSIVQRREQSVGRSDAILERRM